MAQIDHSIYLQSRGPDLGAIGRGIERGMTMRQMVEDRNLKLEQQKRKKGLEQAYSAGFVQNPDGTSSYDPRLTMSALVKGGFGPEAQTIDNQIYQRDTAAKTAQQEQLIKDRDFKLREQELFSRAADRKEARDERRFQSGLVRDEKMQGLQTPYGTANTIDDAKQLKEAHESKLNFDNKLQQMIDLRTKHSGGAIWNREDVARGKQLSRDLLLDYKNMAKLGVLSKSDEDIINAIIPEDPLQYSSPMAAIQGQDPTLARLKSFQSDSDKDFQNRVNTRTRSGLSLQQSNAPKHGTIEDGYVFLGGDPANKKNWMKR